MFEVVAFITNENDCGFWGHNLFIKPSNHIFSVMFKTMRFVDDYEQTFYMINVFVTQALISCSADLC